jgi:glyoxylase-like metal-dependent hydrolase (beta-lactamase superfamily II)
MKSDHGMRLLNREVATWWFYDPQVKCRCYSQACVHQNNLTLIDPIHPKSQTDWVTVLEMGQPTLIILTNGNHERDAKKIQQELKIPIACGEGAIHDLTLQPDIILAGKMQIHGIRPIPIEGAGPGELALFCQSQQAVFIGDAIINLPDTGLSCLPDKYASDPGLLRQSIRALCDYSFSRVCFSHGDPIESNARSAIRQIVIS